MARAIRITKNIATGNMSEEITISAMANIFPFVLWLFVFFRPTIAKIKPDIGPAAIRKAVPKTIM